MGNSIEHRCMELRAAPVSNGKKKSYIVEGYASTFESYVLMRRDGIDYKERIMPDAFKNADMSDVVFRVDHTGKIYARTTAGTLSVWTDKHGLAQRADLSKTQAARDLYEDIAAGNYPRMSFAFKVADGGDRFDQKTHTRIIERIEKVFDVSPVTWPANPKTELVVASRDYFSSVIANDDIERQKLKIKLLAMF